MHHLRSEIRAAGAAVGPEANKGIGFPRLYDLLVLMLTRGRDRAYREALLKSNVFFSPRMREGIGMAFLEAMASGLCVVAPDFPTMNEYIANGTNGILYSLDQTSPLDFSRAQDMGARARETVERGFADWQSSLADLKEFLVTPMPRSESPGHRGMFRLRQRFRL